MLVRQIKYCSKNFEVFPINVFELTVTRGGAADLYYHLPSRYRCTLSKKKNIPMLGFWHNPGHWDVFLFAGVACDIDNADDDLLDRLCGQINGEFTLKTLVRGELAIITLTWMHIWQHLDWSNLSLNSNLPNVALKYNSNQTAIAAMTRASKSILQTIEWLVNREATPNAGEVDPTCSNNSWF